MENFIVSARRYRPDTFDSVVAQASITNTLKNAIKGNQLAHAYLFCGPRGVGKTTCARIFAKTINCTNLTASNEACNACDSCTSFNTSRSFNIHELDAASNNSVDDIRNLTDQVRVPPQVGKYSVYIIDEVHMLSAQAFNAFLKTLEEPPAHAIFILATTEKHKIIPTILSRCQIFDFNRIGVSDIAKYLAFVAKSEKIEVENEGLNIIAQKADGAMRDALSIFDQIVSFSGKSITYRDVITNLNVLDYDYYFKLVDQFLKNDITKVMLTFNEILEHGFDGHHFITGLSNHLRDLLVCKDVATIQLLEVGGEIKERYKEQAQKAESSFLLDALIISNECDYQYKLSNNKRLLIELAIIRIAQLTLKKKIADSSKNNVLEPIFSGKSIPSEIITEQKKTGLKPSGSKPQEQVRPKRITKRTPKNIGTPSIKDALQGKFGDDKITLSAKQQHELHTKTEEFDEFTKEDLAAKWKEFLKRLEDRPNLQSTLSGIPEIKEKYQLLLEIDNSIQLDLINSIKPEIIAFLRRELKNSKIELIVEVTTEIKNKIIYTDNDKFDEMVKKNPSLKKLKQKFNLDLGEV